jgi:hypothetical protein
MAVCVDRHSGWIVAVPGLKKGLTGAQVAQDMLKFMWRPFGIPSLITSDQGSHFVNSWWDTMCAKLGIRQAFSQAYHHQANGRAEMAGQQVMEKLRKLNTEGRINWVESLPHMLDRYHDVPGESGLSPYQILFGRERSIGDIPYVPPRECEDAQNFFDRMSEIDEKVASLLNQKHAKSAKRINESRKSTNIFDIGDKVWYRRPEGSGTKIDTRWVGPGKIASQTGIDSYEVRLGPNQVMPAHATFLKHYVEDTMQGGVARMYQHTRTVVDKNPQVNEEWVVDKVLGHRIMGGIPMFKVLWRGQPMENASWEPINHFLTTKHGDAVVKYCQAKNWDPSVIKFIQHSRDGPQN